MEIIPKEAPKIPPWLDILFYLSAGLLIFVFISYFLVSQSIKASQKAQLEADVKLASEDLKSSKLKKEILTYQKKINDFSVVINGHLEASNAFGFIESKCHPSVWFSNFSLKTKTGNIELSGEAQNFQALGQQMIIFRDEPMITKSSLDSITMGKGGSIGFKVTLSLDPSVFIF
jgi:hypothetical protein